MSRSSFNNPAYVFLAGKAHAKTAPVRNEASEAYETSPSGALGWSLLSFAPAKAPQLTPSRTRRPQHRRSHSEKKMQRSQSAVRFNTVVDHIDSHGQYEDDRYDKGRGHYDDEDGDLLEDDDAPRGQYRCEDPRRAVKSRKPTGAIDSGGGGGGSGGVKHSTSSTPYVSAEHGEVGAYGGLLLLQEGSKAKSPTPADPDAPPAIPIVTSHKKGFGAKLVGAAMRMGGGGGGGGGGKTHREPTTLDDSHHAVPHAQLEDQKYMTAPSMTEAFAPVFADAASLYMPSRTYNADNDRAFHENLTNLPRSKSSGFAAIVESAIGHKIVATDKKHDATSKRRTFMQAVSGGEKASARQIDDDDDSPELSLATQQRLKDLARNAKAKARAAHREESEASQSLPRPQQHRSRTRSEEEEEEEGEVHQQQRQATSPLLLDKRRHSRLPTKDAIDEHLYRTHVEDEQAVRHAPPRSHNVPADAPPTLTFEPPTPIEVSMQRHQQRSQPLGDAVQGRHREPTMSQIRAAERGVPRERDALLARQIDVRISGELFRMEQQRKGDDVIVIGRDGHQASGQVPSSRNTSEGSDDGDAPGRRHHHRRHHRHRSRSRTFNDEEGRGGEGEDRRGGAEGGEMRERRHHRRHRERDADRSNASNATSGRDVGERDEIAWEEGVKPRPTQQPRIRHSDDSRRNDIESRSEGRQHHHRHHSREPRQSSERERRHGNSERPSSERERRGDKVEYRDDDDSRRSFEHGYRNSPISERRSMVRERERERDVSRSRQRGPSQREDIERAGGGDDRRDGVDRRERRRSRRMSYSDRFASAMMDETDREERVARYAEGQPAEGIRRQASQPMLSQPQRPRQETTLDDRQDSGASIHQASSAAAAELPKPKAQKSGLIRTLMHGMQHAQSGGTDAVAPANIDEGSRARQQRGTTADVAAAASPGEPKRLAKIVGPEDEQRLGMAIDFARERMQRELMEAKAEKRRQMSMPHDDDGNARVAGSAATAPPPQPLPINTAAPQQSRPSLDRARKTMTTLLTRKMSTKAMRNDEAAQQQQGQEQQPPSAALQSMRQRQTTIYADEPSPVLTIAPERERAHLDEAFREAVRADQQQRKDQQKMFQNPSLIQPHTQAMQMPPW